MLSNKIFTNLYNLYDSIIDMNLLIHLSRKMMYQKNIIRYI